jgi:hypothetical protein
MSWTARKNMLDADELIDDLPAVKGQDPKERVQREVQTKVFHDFLPATESPEMLAYLEKRLFMFPEEVAERFNLKFSPNGKWAGRLIIPLTVGWTGRSVRDHIEPRYESETTDAGFFLYGKGETGLIVEGPIDAMKIAAVSVQFAVFGMTGNRISPALIVAIKTMKIKRLIQISDTGVALSQQVALTQELRNNLPLVLVERANLPENPETGEPFKDCGEMSASATRKFIYRF